MKNNQLLMGYAETDITPSGQIETIGFGREDNLSRGILHSLTAGVSVWKMEGESGKTELCCLITIDHIGFSKEHARHLRDTVGELIQGTRENVMLCFSHTHSAPNDDASPEYYHMVCGRIKDAAKRACGCMEPVAIGWGNAYVDIGLNRRRESSALDRRCGILKVCSAENGALKLLILRLTAHGNVLKRDNYLISPDYFGAVRDRFEKEYSCPVMVVQGAAGNVAPRYFKSKETPVDAADDRFIRSDTALEDMAGLVFEKVSPVLDTIRLQENPRLQMNSKNLVLKADVPTYEEALEVAKDAERYCHMDGTAWLGEVRRLLESDIKEQADLAEVQYFFLGNGCLCGVSYEIMTEFALDAWHQLKDEYFYLNGYTNGCTGYFPTEEEFDRGGYEVYWSMVLYYQYFGRVYPLRRNSASELMKFVVEGRM